MLAEVQLSMELVRLTLQPVDMEHLTLKTLRLSHAARRVNNGSSRC